MSIIESAIAWPLRQLVRRGTLRARLGDTTVVLGADDEDPEGPVAEITLADRATLLDLVRRGTLGFAEGYMDGRLTTPDLPGVLEWGVANHDAWRHSRVAAVLGALRGLWIRAVPHRRHHRVQTMVDHYDLGNDFYSAWLDPTLTYSSARFDHPGQSLEDAQRHKYATIAAHAGLRPGMEVLEIGCGWGGFAEYAAGELGCRVVGLTVSEQQAAHARKRMAAHGLTDLVDIRLEDFRETRGTFDAVVSIEMIESIDEPQWPELFTAVEASLSPGGLAVLQAITIDDALWDRYRRSTDFIREFIFPGGRVPAPRILRRLAREHGLAVEQVETFGLDYARTLAHWRRRFEAAWPELDGERGLDERFHRMWELYLVLCEAGFRSGRVDVQQWVLSRD